MHDAIPDHGLQRPLWPRPAASMAMLRGAEVLIVRRGMAPNAGVWSLPGGHIEPGEKAADAALREVLEETSVEAEMIGLVGVHDGLVRDRSGRLVAHYVLAVYCGRWTAGEPLAASDVSAARFVAVDELSAYDLTPGVHDLIVRAVQISGSS